MRARFRDRTRAGSRYRPTASARNGRWADPARFPTGGHYGAPRGGGAHAGQDVTNSTGTGVYAAAAGTVVRRSWGGGLAGRTGNALVLSHGGGQYTYHGHLSAYRVALGATVAAGRRIADMGATGNVTGPHLHFETHTGGLGVTSDPVTFLDARGVDLGGGWPRTDPGASGATVVVIQHLMKQRGYGLVVDGQYGTVSFDAVERFQRAGRGGRGRDGVVPESRAAGRGAHPVTPSGLGDGESRPAGRQARVQDIVDERKGRGPAATAGRGPRAPERSAVVRRATGP
ncbi:M23 family metallopeptidase [Streptomyces sp. NPDC057429]|uniref:M23 family metallopeptidase n=1 Tax=Streptomyces sp. NPDC057429 TaxID=3346130 RepID=UPI003676421F